MGADNVGSRQFQNIRQSLEGLGVVLMGKNTMMRKAIRGHLEHNPGLERWDDNAWIHKFSLKQLRAFIILGFMIILIVALYFIVIIFIFFPFVIIVLAFHYDF